ncbi:actin-related protein 10-like [Clavelina lepadiformis]|uniref:actin-related protein 10-like n=1 Tax=Clavelina lepadiformis TaxID=159417 RepID=UPI004042DC85
MSYKKLGMVFGGGNPIVLDIGETYTKLGFAGEPEPRAVIPTAIQKVGGPLTYILKSDRSCISQHLHCATLKQSISKFLEKVFFKILQINPKHQRVLLCESLLNPTKIREVIAEVLFHQFEVAALVFAPHHLLACFTVAMGTGLVVDCAYNETIVLPVIEGTPILWAWQSAPLGGSGIQDEIMKEISEKGKIQVHDEAAKSVTSRLSERVLEDIKVKACFVTQYERAKLIHAGKLAEWRKKNVGDSTSEQEITKPSPALSDMVYPLDGVTRLIIPGSVREEVAEVLFEQDNDDTSISTMVLDSLLQCPVVSRKELAQNLLVIGGTSLLPGFRHRLLFELKEFAESEEKYRSKLSQCEFRVHNPPVPANLVSWLGASIFASLESFQHRLVTKEYFNQHNRKLPDWCGLPFPDKTPEASSHTTPASFKGGSHLGSSKNK